MRPPDRATRRQGGQATDRRAMAWGAALLFVCVLFLAYDIGRHPIVLWDESRVVSNALEMSQGGFSLVTTYGFKPDLWNTKPPLLIWLIAGAIRLFGFSDWAVRLPSLLAAAATVALVMRFSWRLSHSPFVAVCATLLLVLSPGYFGVHAARSADYEALLCLFTTAYLLLLFEVIHRRRPAAWRVLAVGLLVAGACLTKGVAGLIPGVGVGLYVVVRRRWPRLFETPWYGLGALVTVGLVGGFYLAREQVSAGYLQAVMGSELTGRYLHAMPGHVRSPVYYLVGVFLLFAFGPLLVAVCAAPALRWPRTKSAAFLTYGGFVSVAMLAVLSFSRTKLFWYAAPLYPILSIMGAIVLRRLLALLPSRPGHRVQIAHWLLALGAVYVLVHAVSVKAVGLAKAENNPQGRYGLVFAELDRAGVRRVRTLDGGVPNDDSLVGYTPQLHVYALAWRARGMDIQPIGPADLGKVGPDAVVVTCDRRYLRAVSLLGPPLTRVGGCAAGSLARP